MNLSDDLEAMIQHAFCWTLYLTPVLPLMLYTTYYSYTMLAPVVGPVIKWRPRLRTQTSLPQEIEQAATWNSLRI